MEPFTEPIYDTYNLTKSHDPSSTGPCVKDRSLKQGRLAANFVWWDILIFLKGFRVSSFSISTAGMTGCPSPPVSAKLALSSLLGSSVIL